MRLRSPKKRSFQIFLFCKQAFASQVMLAPMATEKSFLQNGKHLPEQYSQSHSPDWPLCHTPLLQIPSGVEYTAHAIPAVAARNKVMRVIGLAQIYDIICRSNQSIKQYIQCLGAIGGAICKANSVACARKRQSAVSLSGRA